MRSETESKIVKRLNEIKEKHPVFKKDQALAILTEEIGEVAKEIQNENKERLQDELLDVIAFAIRWLEYDQGKEWREISNWLQKRLGGSE